MFGHFDTTCDVRRRAESPQAYGGKAAYTTVAQAVPCYMEMRQQRGFNSITAQWVTTTGYLFHFRPRIDVREGDELTNVVQRGELLQSGGGTPLTFRIDGGVIPAGGAGVQLLEVQAVKVQ